MDSTRILSFLSGVVRNECPDEESIFEANSVFLLRQVTEGTDLSILLSDSNAENEFMHTEGPAITSFALLSATVKTVMELTNSRGKTTSSVGIREKWMHHLTHEGFNGLDAEKLADTYIEQLLANL